MTSTPNANQIPSWSEIIGNAIEDRLFGLNTCMPGEVTSFNKLKNTCDVKPGFKKKYVQEDEAVELPEIKNVPIVYLGGGSASISFPLNSGDPVLLLFSQRSLEKWKDTGRIDDPNDPRIGSLSDAICIPGLRPLSQFLVIDDGLLIRNGTSKFLIKKNGSITITTVGGEFEVTASGKFAMGNGVVDALKQLEATIKEIQKLTVGTALGPSTVPINAPAFLLIEQLLATILK